MPKVDSDRRVETPEGVELHLRPAGPVARALALLVDQTLLWLFYAFAVALLGTLGEVGGALFLILFFLGQWLYPVFFEVLGDGRSPGKRLLQLRVVGEDGLPAGWGASLLRNLLRGVDGLPFAYTVGLVAVLVSRNHQRLGDLAAGTLVVHEPAPARRLPVPDGPVGVAPAGLSVEEQSSLIAYAERSGVLTPARAQELGDLLAPLSGATGAAGMEALLAMARGIRGAADAPGERP